MIIVSDTTAISSLHKIQQLHLLQSIFGVVIIPQQVFDELKFFELKDLSFNWSEKYPWIKTETVTDNTLLDSLSENLDEGEAAAIALTIELHADLLLIDERQGRKIALERKLNIIGVVGVIEIAKRKNLLLL